MKETFWSDPAFRRALDQLWKGNWDLGVPCIVCDHRMGAHNMYGQCKLCLADRMTGDPRDGCAGVLMGKPEDVAAFWASFTRHG